MISGDSISVGVVLGISDVPQHYADVASARAAGWDVVFYDSSGALLATQPTVTLTAPTVATATRARTSNVATIGTGTAHGLRVGQLARIAGVGGTGYNATLAPVLSTPTATSFTYASTGSNEGSTADTGGTVRQDDGYHALSFTCPAGWWTARVRAPANGQSTPLAITGEGESYDNDSIGALVNAGTRPADPYEPTAASTLTIYDGNSILVDLSISETALAYIGAANLAACTLSAGIKLTSKTSDDPADVTLTPTVVTDTTGARVVRCQVDTFPAALAIPDGVQELAARLDVRLTKSGRTVTGAVVAVTVKWKANT